MEIKRTANAGVLLKLDGVSVLLDGVCGEVVPYLPTPPAQAAALLENVPDVLAFTHSHADHYDAAFVSNYLQTAAGPVLGPADIPFSRQDAFALGGVRLMPVQTRHLGKAGKIAHVSYIIQGSRCVWFVGDASPLCFAHREDLPKPDVLIAPYAYATGSGWDITKHLDPSAVVLLHLPEREHDPYGLWQQVEAAAGQGSGPAVYIPAMGQKIRFAD